MARLRRASERGRTRLDWLDSSHTFSFGGYRDPRFTGFGALRVVNEDRVAPGRGFGAHAHRDMEILTWVVAGALEHGDSLGNGSVVRAGELQRMCAGTGVVHREHNPSPAEPVHFLQIWIMPERRGLAPEYAQRAWADRELRAGLRLLASPDGRDSSVRIHQDVSLLAARLAADECVEHALGDGRRAWLQVVRGALAVNGEEAGAGDGVAIEGERGVRVEAKGDAEVLLFDLA